MASMSSTSGLLPCTTLYKVCSYFATYVERLSSVLRRYTGRTMYTIKEAAARTGLTVPVLRAWERRYGVVAPARTAGGYRVYDEAALGRLRSMRRLIDDGWSPSAAAAAIIAGTEPPAGIPTDSMAEERRVRSSSSSSMPPRPSTARGSRRSWTRCSPAGPTSE